VVATLIAQVLSINVQVEAKGENLRRENVSLKYQLSPESRGLYIVGKSLSMQEVQRQIEKVAPTRATVLLLGESGTGKTLIGRIIHDLSDRNGFPFIKVNCASIPENLLESELFGYEKGASPARMPPSPAGSRTPTKAPSFWTRSGNCPGGFRPSFCACCRTGIRASGQQQDQRVDVRILAATNKDLGALAESGTFRPDLITD
jgi:Nif-specific regulatory protein